MIFIGDHSDRSGLSEVPTSPKGQERASLLFVVCSQLAEAEIVEGRQSTALMSVSSASWRSLVENRRMVLTAGIGHIR